MKKCLFLIILFVSLTANASQYNVYSPQEFGTNKFDNLSEKTLFILDFSSSMTETLDGVRKVDLMLDTMRRILPQISPNRAVGLRVYGQRLGLTSFDMCRASSLSVPVAAGNAKNISNALEKTSPRGMTPITYSLKQAVKNDFAGFSGNKHIILLTDGGENCDESPCQYVMELIQLRNDIKIDVIAFNINNKTDLEQLKCVSLVTRGKFYTANTAAELVKSLADSINMRKDVQAVILK